MDIPLLRRIKSNLAHGVKLSRRARCVLLGLALCKHNERRECTPAVAEIAGLYEYSRACVFRGLAELEKKGIVKRTERTDATGRKRPKITFKIGVA